MLHCNKHGARVPGRMLLLAGFCGVLRRAFGAQQKRLRVVVLTAGGIPSGALAQEPIIGTATLPRDLTPWGMFQSADSVVKGVLIGLVIASVITWTVWLAKTV